MVTPERVGKLVETYRDRARAKPRRRSGLSPEAIRKGPPAAAIAKRERAREFYADIMEPVWKLQAEGLPLRAIASILNAEGYTTRRGCQYNAAQVMRVLNLATA